MMVQIAYLRQDGSMTSALLSNMVEKPSLPPLRNMVDILTSDDEVFPVKRRLLRPCIALTSVVQDGKGKYKLVAEQQQRPQTSMNAENASSEDLPEEECIPAVRVPVDACTFDRVLLYLEHEARGEQFRFDPLLASELLTAADALGIQGLKDCCEKVLGSFQERVRKVPIRYEEIVRRNALGSVTAIEDGSGKRKRSETLLILSGMVRKYMKRSNKM